MVQEVLIVDDSDFMRNLLREILESEYEIVAEAANGVEAVEYYAEYDPDIVVMDLVMPLRDGIEATEEIKEADPSARVIMCSSIGQQERLRSAIKVGAAGFITKPFKEPSVLAEINQVATA